MRRRVDICSVQEHRWLGGLEANQTCLEGKNSHYKFFWCGNKDRQGGAGILLVERWMVKVLDAQWIFD